MAHLGVRRLAAAFLPAGSLLSLFDVPRTGALVAKPIGRAAVLPCSASDQQRHNASSSIQAYNYRMDRSKLLVVETFASQIEADLAKRALESAGIRAMIQADAAGGMDPAIAWCGFGFKVLVREEDFAEARQALNPPQDASTEAVPPTGDDAADPKPSN